MVARLWDRFGMLPRPHRWRWLAASGLEYTILRPGRLFDGAPTGCGMVVANPSIHGSISRVELAAVILRTLDDPGTVGRTLSVVNGEVLSGSAVDRDICQPPMAIIGRSRL